MSHLPFDVVIPDSVWRRALLAYAVLLGMFVLMIALDLSMDTVRALPHVFAADAPERSQMTQGQLVGFYLGYGVLPLVAMVLLAVVAGVIAWGLKGDEDGVILFILLVWSGMSWSVIFLFPTSRAMHGALGLEWDYVQPPYVNVDNVLAVGFLLLFPCLLRLSVLFPERAIGAPADLDSHARRLREWSLGLKIPIAVGAILAAGLGIGTVIPSAAAAGVWAAIGIFLGAIGLNFYAAARAADRGARARIGWIGALVITLLVLPVVSLYASGSSSAFWSTGLFLSIPLFATSLLAFIVVFGAGAIDPRLAIHRTALFSILALGGVFAFGVIETAVTDYLISTAGLPQGTGAMIAGGIMAVTFKPAHGFIERLLNRFFDAPDTHQPKTPRAAA